MKLRMVNTIISKENYDDFSYNTNVHFNTTSKQLVVINKLDQSTPVSTDIYGDKIGLTLPGFLIQPDIPKKLYINHHKEK